MTSTTSDPLQSDLTAVDVAWDLEPLVDGRGAEGVDALLDDAEARAQALASYRGRVGELDVDGPGRADDASWRRSVSWPDEPVRMRG